jgi:digeranylgeranylglycerophospholipid reductase
MVTAKTDADVIVVGAGPAGLAAAAVVAGRGRRALVLDRGTGIGVPVRTSGGSFIRPLRRLGLPRHLWHPVHRIRIIGPGHDHTFALHRPAACVLDVRETYQWLAARAVDAGAEIRLRAPVRAPLLDDGRVIGVRLAEDVEVTSRVVVDASGYRAVIATHLGLRPAAERRAIGHEQEVYAPHYDQDEAILVVGDDVAPGGYGWAFPCGRGRVRLGVGVVRPDSTADPLELLASLVERVPALQRSCSPLGALEVHAGVMPAADPGAILLVGPGLVMAGDSGVQGSTLLGEGIRHAVAAGRLAGEAAAAASALDVAPGPAPARAGARHVGTGAGHGALERAQEALEAYPVAWQRSVGRQMDLAWHLHLRVCRYDDADWARILEVVRHLRPGQVARALAGDLTPGWALRTLVTSPRVALAGGSLLRAAAGSADRAEQEVPLGPR